MSFAYKTFCIKSRKFKDYVGITQSWDWIQYRKNHLLICLSMDRHDYVHKIVLRAIKDGNAYKGAAWKILEGNEIPPEVQAYLLLIP